MADKREFLVVIAGKETASKEVGKVDDALGDLSEQAKKTEHDFDGLDKKLKEHADTITHLREEIAKTGDTKLFGELGRQERAFGKLDGLRKSLIGAAADAAPEMAVELGGRFGPLLARMPLSGPMAIALTTAAAAAAPFLGATVAAGLLGGAAGGGIVGGLLIAKNDASVKAAAKGVAESIGDQLKDSAAPFVPATVNALNIVRDEARSADGDLRKLFQSTARYLEPLARGAGSGASGFLSGFTKAAENAEPVIDALADGLASFGQTAGDVFADLAGDGPAAADALRQTFTLLNITLSSTGKTIDLLADSYGFLRKTQAWLTGDTETLARMITQEAAAKSGANEVTGEYTRAQQDLTEQVKASDEAFRKQIESVGAANDAYADGRRATWDFKDSLAGLKEQVDENGTSLNENTAKGRDNLRYLDGAIQKADKAADAARDFALANGASAEGAAAAGAMLRRTWINDLVAAATKAGIAKKDIERMVAAAKKADGTQIDLYFNQRYRTFGRPINPTPQYVTGLSKGGEVGGGGPPGQDTQLRMLASDEFVLTGEQVRAAGGPGAVKSALRGGGGAAVAAAGGGMGGGRDTAITLTLDLVGMLRKTIRVGYGGNTQLALGG